MSPIIMASLQCLTGQQWKPVLNMTEKNQFALLKWAELNFRNMAVLKRAYQSEHKIVFIDAASLCQVHV